MLVVLALPVGDGDPGMGQGPEQLDVQAFVAEPAVEGFDVAVAPGFAGWDDASPTRSPAQSAIAVQANSARCRSAPRPDSRGRRRAGRVRR